MKAILEKIRGFLMKAIDNDPYPGYEETGLTREEYDYYCKQGVKK